MTYPLSSSPYQRVPSTPQVITRTNLFSSPSFRVPQVQNLYSSPVPDGSAVDVRDGLQSSPVPFQALSRDDGSLISEGAVIGGLVEQVVPATPNRITDYAFGSQIQVPFTIDSWTSETPQMYPFRFQNQMVLQTSSVVLSQEEIAIEQSRETQTPTDSRLNVRRTPSNQRRISNASRITSPRSRPRPHSVSVLPTIHSSPQPVAAPQSSDSWGASEAVSDVLTPTRPPRNTPRTNLRRTPSRLSNASVIQISQNSQREPPARTQASEQVSPEIPRRLSVLLQRQATPLLNRGSRITRSRSSSEMDIFSTDNIFG